MIQAAVAVFASILFVYILVYVRRLQKDRVAFKEQLGTLAELSDAGIWLWDPGNNVFIPSKICRRHLGLADEGGVTYEQFINALYPDDRTRTVEALRQSFESSELYYSEFRVVRPDEAMHWLVAKGLRKVGAKGKSVCIQGVMFDITERKQLENRLLELTADAYEAQAAKAKLAVIRKEMLEKERLAYKELEAFSYSAAHDLRAPLFVVDGYARTLMEDCADKLDPQALEKLNYICAGVERLRQLIADLLALARIDRQEIKYTQILMAELTRQVFGELKSMVPERKIECRIGELPPTHGDEGMMRQVLVNFIANAIKFTRKTDPAVIEVGFQDNAKETIYYVKDNGAGFDMHYSEKLFGAFQRLHSHDQFEDRKSVV